MDQLPLQPTLWRTCRVLANQHRLHMLRELIRCPNQTVAQIARSVAVPIPVASLYLRALNARGLLRPTRSGRYVRYHAAPDPRVADAAPLLKALQDAFSSGHRAIEKTLWLLTSFTHPRRIMIVKALPRTGLTLAQLRLATGISHDALTRHLAKLRRRGILVVRHGRYTCARPRTRLGRTLLALARQ